MVLLAGMTAGQTGCSTSTHAASGAIPAKDARPEIALACQGRVEGRTETIEIGAAADGVIQEVYVKEGDFVHRGAKLAEIGCSDLVASLQEAIAQVESAKQVRQRLLRGAREEERRVASEQTRAARSVLQRATVQLERLKPLYAKNVVSRSAFDDAQRDYEVALANEQEAIRREQLVNAPALPEDLAKAAADIAAAEEAVRVIREKIAKYTVTAPIDGTILRVLLRPGESFSTLAPRPLFTISDLSVRRVRAEIDERDVLKVQVGQKVLVSPPGREEEKFTGKVQLIASSMGRKRILSGDPAEKADHDVLESVILMQPAARTLPVGMRVVVQFLR